MNENSPHIGFETLTDLIVGALTGVEKNHAEEHLRRCAACARLRARVEKVVRTMRSDALEEVPPPVFARALDLFGERRPEPAAPGLIERLVAVLAGETSSLTPAFGLRSGRPETVRRLELTAGAAEIEIEIERTGAGWSLAGRVFGLEPGGEARLQSGTAAFDAEIGDLGDFAFASVSAGRYKLTLRFSGLEIEVPEITLDD